MRYAIYDTDSGEMIRQYTAGNKDRAKAHGNQPGCRLELIKQPRKPRQPSRHVMQYQKARRVADALQDQSFPF